MAEYIEREAAYRFAQDQLKKETGAYSRGWNHAMNVMKSALHNNDALPTADVVPVVRCKDCKRYVPAEDGGKMMCVKDADWCVEDGCYYGFTEYHDADWFCADGEKRSENG